MKYEFINNNFILYKFFFLIILIFISIRNIIDLLLLNFSKNITFTKEDVLKIMKYINVTLYDKLVNKIKVAIYSHSLNNGGVERNTALLINYLSKIKIFELYIFTNIITKSEYKLSDNVKRIIVSNQLNRLKRHLISYKINIFIYQSYDKSIITMLKGLKSLKVIFYNHSCFLFWIYYKNRFILNNIYNEYKNAKYIISIVPFENNYLFKNWGINSIYMNNFLTYDYIKVIPSDLSSKKILMIGRGSDKNKRFELGIRAMKFILKEIPDSEMIIISDDKDIINIKYLVNILKIQNTLNSSIKYLKSISP